MQTQKKKNQLGPQKDTWISTQKASAELHIVRMQNLQSSLRESQLCGSQNILEKLYTTENFRLK